MMAGYNMIDPTHVDMVATVGLIVSTVCVSSCSGEALLIYYALSTIRLSVPV